MAVAAPNALTTEADYQEAKTFLNELQARNGIVPRGPTTRASGRRSAHGARYAKIPERNGQQSAVGLECPCHALPGPPKGRRFPRNGAGHNQREKDSRPSPPPSRESILSNSTFIHSLTLGALFLGAAAVAPSAHAQSCSNSVSVVHSSYPADGARGVPTNTPLYVYGPELEVGTSDITLEDARGEAVSFDERAADGGLLIDAFLGLAPNTTYELTVTSPEGDEWSATFTTGTGPAQPVQLRAPDVKVSVIDQDRATCGVVSAICVIGSVPSRMTLEVLVDDEVLSLGGGQPAPAFTANAGSVAANDCIEVRVREPGGNVSQSTELCGAELARFELAANAPAPTSCQPYSVAPASNADAEGSSSSDSGGCVMGASGVASGAGGLLFGLSVLLAALRRRGATSGRWR
jgi:hypothetical protein